MAATHYLDGSQIKPKTITLHQISNPTIHSLRGQTGPSGVAGHVGPAGSQGASGAVGPAGAPAQGPVPSASSLGEQVITQTALLSAGDENGKIANCPSGTVIIGGGVANIQETTPATTGFAYVTEDGPYLGDSNSVPTEWIGDVYNTHNTSITYDVYAICIVAQ